MLKIEKTLQSVRDLLDRLSKEGVEFALVESEYSDYVADIRNPNKVYVFLECSIRPNGTFVWRDYDHHKGVCDFDEFRVRIITLTADKYLDKAKDKRKQWASLCDGTESDWHPFLIDRHPDTKLPCMKLGYKPMDWYLNPNQAEPYDLFTAFLEDATTTLFERKEPDHEPAWRKTRTPIARQIPLW